MQRGGETDLRARPRSLRRLPLGQTLGEPRDPFPKARAPAAASLRPPRVTPHLGLRNARPEGHVSREARASREFSRSLSKATLPSRSDRKTFPSTSSPVAQPLTGSLRDPGSPLLARRSSELVAGPLCGWCHRAVALGGSDTGLPIKVRAPLRGFQRGALLPPSGHLATSGDDLGCLVWKCYQHRVGRG